MVNVWSNEPDGVTLATAGGGVVRVWDLRAPAAPREVNVGGAVRLLAGALGGNRLAGGGKGNDGLVLDNGAPAGKRPSDPRAV